MSVPADSPFAALEAWCDERLARRLARKTETMKRKDTLNWLKIAGYHNNQSAYVRIFVEGRVSREAADEAWRRGIDAKAAGMPCHCKDCTKEAE
jgi:hypothetical protein